MAGAQNPCAQRKTYLLLRARRRDLEEEGERQAACASERQRTQEELARREAELEERASKFEEQKRA
ncbi:MAG TPA: hypothetical protein VMZ31_01460, partial [Phycisphaerae bacterium]|nr:hypothetical protein [Phycisphaerae bacterium]